MSTKSPKKWNCLEEIRNEIKEKEKVEKAIWIRWFLQRGKSEKVSTKCRHCIYKTEELMKPGFVRFKPKISNEANDLLKKQRIYCKQIYIL